MQVELIIELKQVMKIIAYGYYFHNLLYITNPV